MNSGAFSLAGGTVSGEVIAEMRGVTKRFGQVTAAEDLSLSIGRGEFLSFLGPSGCGKTTALRMLAGFEAPTEGEVLLDGRVVNDLAPYDRPVNMVFQHYALFPHLGVADNIAYGLRQRRPRPPASEIRARVARALDLVRLPGFEKRRIWEMSGGQQQRVALARAIVNEPKLLLLDEPMAALDRKLRKEMQIELLNLQRELGITFVLVTHDQEEALSMSDRICLMRDGRIAQIGSPQELYDHPRSRYVAGFVGTSNFFDGTLRATEGGLASVVLASGLDLTGRPVGAFAPGAGVTVSVRPEQISLSATGGDAETSLAARVRARIFLGEHTEYHMHSDAVGAFVVFRPRLAEAAGGAHHPGDGVYASWDRDAALVLTRD